MFELNILIAVRRLEVKHAMFSIACSHFVSFKCAGTPYGIAVHPFDVATS